MNNVVNLTVVVLTVIVLTVIVLRDHSVNSLGLTTKIIIKAMAL